MEKHQRRRRKNCGGVGKQDESADWSGPHQRCVCFFIENHTRGNKLDPEGIERRSVYCFLLGYRYNSSAAFTKKFTTFFIVEKLHVLFKFNMLFPTQKTSTYTPNPTKKVLFSVAVLVWSLCG